MGDVDDHEDMTESMREVMSLDGDVDKLATYYARWADEYDDDVASHGYGLPEMMVQTLQRAIGEVRPDSPAYTRSPNVLDAGCGTGLVGAALHAAGWSTIDGVDLSHEMADNAAVRGIYRSVRGGVDLTVPPTDDLRHSAPIVTVGGVFTVGHVPPEALEQMAELVEPGGILVVSTRRAYHEETDFHAARERLESSGRLHQLVHLPDAPYTMDSTGDYWAWQTMGSGLT